MWEMLKNWYYRRFSDPEALSLLTILLTTFITLYFFSDIIAPLLFAIALAYLLEWPVGIMENRFKFPRVIAVSITFLLFLSLFSFIVIVIIPRLWNQSANLINDLPNMINQLHDWVMSLPTSYPEFIDYAMLDSIFSAFRVKIINFGESIVQFSITSIISLVTLGIYAFLVPMMVFFLVKDRNLFIRSFLRILPRRRHLASRVWHETQEQLSNYIRGKFIEISIVSIVTYIIFFFFQLHYPLLLAVLIGLSVLIPYIGAVVVAVPLILVALFQFGLTPEFWYLMLAYVISQLLDGNVLVPILYSEAVNLHPLFIIIAVLVFGGIWGFWGVFFAIPLATLVKAIYNSWPTVEPLTSSMQEN